MTLVTAEIGRRKNVLNDVSEGHAAVLQVVHKELDAFRRDVEQSTDERIDSVLRDINALAVQLGQRVEKFQQISDAISTQQKGGLDSIETALSKAVGEISEGQASALVGLKGYLLDIEQRCAEFRNEVATVCQRFSIEQIEAASSKAVDHISSERSLAVIELKRLLQEIAQSRDGFSHELADVQQGGAESKKDFEVKLSAALSYANKVNAESRAFLRKVNERQKALVLREAQLNKRSRDLIVGSALAILAALAFSVWLILRH